MNADSPGLEAEPAAVSSFEVSMFGSRRRRVATAPITASASSVGSCSRSTSSGPESISVPADSIRLLTQTVKPS